MLKGINRRIIEINRTNNDYFEKAILFVKNEKSDCNQQTITKQANIFLNELAVKNKRNSKMLYKIILSSFITFLFCSFVFIMILYFDLF